MKLNIKPYWKLKKNYWKTTPLDYWKTKPTKPKYQVRGLFPSGDMVFDTYHEAKKFQNEMRKKGYKVDREIYRV